LKAYARDQITLAYSHTHARTATPRAPVVCLHGLASNSSRWREFARETTLSNGRDIFCPDLRGHGRSMTRTPFTRDTWRDDVVALMDEYNAFRFCLVGHSLGAQVALAIASEHPQRVESMVLIDPVFSHALTAEKKAAQRKVPLYAVGVKVMRLLNRAGVYRRTLATMDLEAMDIEARLALDSPAELAAFVKKYSSTREDLRSIPHANYGQDVIELFRPLPRLLSVVAPTLILRSSKADFHDPAAWHAQVKQLKQHEVRTIECHHWPVTEKPEEVRAHIESWFSAA
jgi:pimeloyl-ACP methyl ester carboxylesterase